MSSLRTSLPLVLISVLLLGGCADKNSGVVFSPDTGHGANWKSVHNVAARNDIEQCKECHGSDLKGGISTVNCLSCHTNSPEAQPTGCASCHGDGDAAKSGPTGFLRPDMAGTHAKHVAIPGVDCSTCHFGAGSGTANHANGTINVLFLNVTTLKGRFLNITSIDVASQARRALSKLPPYKTGGATETTTPATNCFNVACHGGNKTPSWYGGAISGDCSMCHELGSDKGVPQLNSYYSGGHKLHLALKNANITCVDCHNAELKKQSQHFSGIFTRSFSQPSNTVGGGTTKFSSYQASGTTSTCLGISCHVNASMLPNAKWFDHDWIEAYTRDKSDGKLK